MLKQTIALIAAFAATGCATVDSLQSGTPEVEVQSAKSMAEISPCLQRFFSAAPLTDEQGRQIFVNKNGYGAVLATLTLVPNDKGTLVQERRTGMSITGGWQKCL